MKKLFIYENKNAVIKEFIEFWEKRYSYSEEIKYEKIIKNKDFELALKWKNGLKEDTHLSKANQEIARKIKEECYKDLERFSRKEIGLKEIFGLLNKATKGIIYKFLIINIFKPEDYPLIDQHTFRAFNYITKGNYEDKVEELKEYKNFRSFVLNIKNETGFSLRKIDKALMAFGQFIKKYR